MTNPGSLLDGDADDVGAHLLHVARTERAPYGARERALSAVTTVAAGALLASTAKGAVVPALSRNVALLGAKWLAIGLSSTLLALTAGDRIALVLSPRAQGPVSAPPSPVPREPEPLRAADASGVAAPPSVPSAAARDAPLRHRLRAPTDVPAPVPMSSPTSAAFQAPNVAQLAREVAALRRARAELAAGKPALALASLVAYHREFPSGVLGTEEAALRVEIAFARADDDAPRRAELFLAQYPTSPLSARLRALLEAKRQELTKP